MEDDIEMSENSEGNFNSNEFYEENEDEILNNNNANNINQFHKEEYEFRKNI